MHTELRHALYRWPNLMLLIGNIVLALLSYGDGRIFVISVIVGILIRYVFLIFLILIDWRRPGILNRSWIRRMFRDPTEGGACDSMGKETPPLIGQLVFLSLFGLIPFYGFLRFFTEIPFGENP